MTAAPVAARAGVEILSAGDATKFKRFADVLADGLLNLVDLLLRIEKPARDGVIQKLFPLPLEFGDFFVRERKSLLLFVVKVLSPFAQKLVLQLGFVVGHETLDLLPHRLELGLVQDRLAQLFGLLDNDALFGGRLHM